MATTSTAVQEREYTQLERAVYAPSFRKALATILGSDEQADCFLVEVFNQARRVPALQRCTIDSVRFHLLRVAKLRLDPALPNEVFFIPRDMKQADGKYAMELTIQYGYAGLRKLIMRSPEVQDCFTKEVCANDTYESPETPISLPLHRLPSGFQPRGRAIGYYAAIQLQGGNWRLLAMSVAEVESHAKRYGGKDLGPAWNKGTRPDITDGLCSFDKMALKTCLRMLCNGRDVPLTAEIQAALTLADTEAALPTSAERQGYARDGSRPAIPMDTGGTTLDDLSQDLYGTRDKEAVTVQMQGNPRRGKAAPVPRQDQADEVPASAWVVTTTGAIPSSPRRDGPAWDTLRAYQDDARLPSEILERVRSALSPVEPATEQEADHLAGTILDILAAGEEG